MLFMLNPYNSSIKRGLYLPNFTASTENTSCTTLPTKIVRAASSLLEELKLGNFN